MFSGTIPEILDCAKNDVIRVRFKGLRVRMIYVELPMPMAKSDHRTNFGSKCNRRG